MINFGRKVAGLFLAVGVWLMGPGLLFYVLHCDKLFMLGGIFSICIGLAILLTILFLEL